ncbi:MAG: hypothetical protein P8M25_11905 [Paracoccaceae bacterium]|nr:hypothetical protein [Paracoccaceae bacterium]
MTEVSTRENMKCTTRIIAMPSVGFSQFFNAFSVMLSHQSKEMQGAMGSYSSVWKKDKSRIFWAESLPKRWLQSF